MFRGRRLLVEVNHEHASYSLLAGEPLDISHHGEPATVTTRKRLSLPIPAHEPGSPRRSRRDGHRSARDRPPAAALGFLTG